MTTTRWFLTDEARELSSIVGDWSRRSCDMTDHLDDAAIDEGDWWRRANAELALGGLLLGEETGGQGAGPAEGAAVAASFAAVLHPVPFLHAGVMASILLSDAPDLAQGVAKGDLLVVPGWSMTDATAGQACARASLARDGTVTGSLPLVVGVPAADAVVAIVSGHEGPTLVMIDLGAPGVATHPATIVDLTRSVSDIVLEGAPARILGDPGPRAMALVNQAMTCGRALLCAEQASIARTCLEQTVAYALQRRQFGRLIGSFQALKHRMAEMWQLTDSAEAAAETAVAAVMDSADNVQRTVWAASLFCSDSAVRVAEECLQLHGGIGMTWDETIHLYLKRAKGDQLLLGSPSHLVAELGRDLGLSA